MNRAQRRAARQRKPSAPEWSYLDALTGRRLPGGCEDCAAYQTVEKRSQNLYFLTVHHDDTCPTFRAMRSTP